MADWTAEEIALADLLEDLIRVGIWNVRDWSPYSAICHAVGTTVAEASDTMRILLERRVKLVEPVVPRQRISMLLGLETSLWGKPLTTRRLAIKSKYGEERSSGDEATKATIKRRNRECKLLFARILLSEESEPMPKNRGNPPFYARPVEQGKLLRWIDGNSQIIVLSGDSGNGKSSIAAETLALVDDSITTVKVKIDAASPFGLLKSLGQYVDIGTNVELPQAKSMFCSYVRALPPRSMLLIDNASDWVLIEEMVLWSHRTIITTEEDIVPSDLDHDVIRVESAPEDVAIQIVNWFRPDVAERSAARFVEAIGRKPRIIIDCLGMFNESEMALDDMSECIQDEAARIVEIAGTGSRAVHKLYEKYFERISSQRPRAALLIAMLAHLGQPILPNLVAVLTLNNLSKTYNGEPISEAGLSAALKVLESRHLIEVEHGAIRVHSLTLRLFRPVTEQYRSNVHKAAVEGFNDHQLLHTPQNGPQPTLSTSALNWMSPLFWVAGNLSPDEVDQWQPDRIHLMLSSLRWGLVQIGEFSKFITLVRLYMRLHAEFVALRLHPREVYEWYAALYESGQITGEVAAKHLISLYNSESIMNPGQVSHVFYLQICINNKFREFLGWSRDTIRAFSMNLPEEIPSGSLRTYMHYSGRALEKMDLVRQAERQFGLMFIGFKMEPIEKISIAYRAAICAGKAGLVNRITSWLEEVQKIHDELAIEALVSNETAVLFQLSHGWLARQSAGVDWNSTVFARHRFLCAGTLQFNGGMVRESYETFVEAEALTLWLQFGTTRKISEVEGDGDRYRILSNLFGDIDEPRTANRLGLIRVISAGLRSSFSEPMLEDVRTIMSEADRFQDYRTSCQAVVVAIVICNRLEIAAEDALFEYALAGQRRKYGSVTNDDFADWIAGLISDPAALLLI